MLTEKGLVTKIDNDIVWVNTRSKLACSSCQVESTCGNGILEKYLGDKIFISQVPNSLDAKVGEEVTIAIPQASVTKAALIVYFLPILMLFVGALSGSYLFDEESAIALSGLTGLATGLLLIYFYNRTITPDSQYIPKMVSKKSLGFDPGQFDSIEVKNI